MNRIVRYDTGYVTHPGNCRTVNQDNLLLRRGAVDGQDFLLLAVADGMGGMARGEEASGCAVALLDNWWNTEPPALLSAGGPDWPGLENSLAVAIERINTAVRQAVRVDRFPFTVGRYECNLLLDAPTVSKKHLSLLHQNGMFYVQDENSSNYTYLDGQIIPPYTPVPLPASCELRLGSVVLLVKAE